ncbi:MAG: hypothetical protein ACNA8L_09865 [Luteolibacter sp.]|jgi:hypothetical protein
MKTTWILSATALTVGAVGGFITGKSTNENAEAANADAISAMQTRATAGNRNSSAENSTRKSSRATSVEDIYRAPGNLSRLENLMRFYGGLSAEQLREEALKLDDLPLNERMPASFLLFARWAEMDPYGAMEHSNSMGMGAAFVRPTILQSWASVDPENAARYYTANPGQFALMNMGRMMGGGQGAADIIATEWARQDAQGALAWANTLSQGKSSALAAVLGEVAKSDPQKAAQMLDQLAPDDRAGAYASIAGKYGAQDFGAAEAWIRTLPQDQQTDAYAAAIEGLASKSPTEALAQINRMPNGDAKNQLIPSIVGPLARTDPQAAAALINTQSDADVKRDSMRELMPAWTAQDPTAALAFAKTQQPGPVYDRAITSYITSNNSGNPAEMMRLAETIDNERERGWAAGYTAQRWMQSDPDGARSYIGQSELIPEGMRERILDGRPMWGGGRGRGR